MHAVNLLASNSGHRDTANGKSYLLPCWWRIAQLQRTATNALRPPPPGRVEYFLGGPNRRCSEITRYREVVCGVVGKYRPTPVAPAPHSVARTGRPIKRNDIPKQATAPEQDPLTSTDTQPSSTFLDTQSRNNYSILKLLKSSNTSLA